MSTRYIELISRINAITEEMSVLQKDKRRLVNRLMHETPPTSKTMSTNTDYSIPSKTVSTTDVIRVRKGNTYADVD
jgi:hypothetical protein